MAKSSKDVMLPHSKAKVDFYQKYLERYLLILNAAKFTKEINIYDVFCGRGVYEDGGVGSAILAMETIIKVREEHPTRGKKIFLHLNDKNKKHIKAIYDYFVEHYKDIVGKIKCKVTFSSYDAVDMLNDFYNRNMFVSRKGIVNFFFIDPYGYKCISREVLQNLLQMGNNEILLFLPVSFMHRFHRYAFDEEANKGALRLREFIDSFFPDREHPVRRDEAIDIYEYIHYLSKAFSFEKYFTTSYSIERDVRNHFALFFMSSNCCGFEQMLDIKYRLIDEYGFGFHLPERQTNLFAEYFRNEQLEEIKEKLRIRLINMLSLEPRNNKFIYHWLLYHEYHPKMAKDIFRDLYKENLLIIKSLATGKLVAKNTFYLDYHHSKRPELIYSLIK